MKFKILHSTGKTADLEVSDAVFDVKVNKPLLAQAVRVYLSNQRQGTSKSKTRSEIARTKKKWFKQKGTGNARHGARSANIFVGGGTVHGPTGKENWSLNLSKMLKKKALASALTTQREKIIVTTMLSDIQPKTKDAHAYLQRLAHSARRVLLVVDKKMDNIIRSTNNLSYVEVTTAQRLNIYELLLAEQIIITKEAVHQLEARVVGAEKKEPVKSEVKTEVKTEAKTAPKKTVKKTDQKKKIVKKETKKQTEVKKTTIKSKSK